MKKRFTQSVKNGAALVCAALLLAVCAGGLKAQNPWPDYDFKAANADGDTLYYRITSATAPYTVAVTRCHDSVYHTLPWPQYSWQQGQPGFLYPVYDYDSLITIPSSVTYGGLTYTVNAIDKEAFFYQKGMHTVVLPASVETIDTGAFYGSSLHHIVMSPNVTRINYYAFESTPIESVELPVGLTYIGEEAFAFSSLSEVEIPASVTTLPHYAFYRCPLTKITFNEGLQVIEQEAFSPQYIDSIVFPGSLRKIEAFNDGTVFLYDTVCCRYVEFQNGPDPLVLGDNCFFGFNYLGTVILSDNITRLGANCFRLTNIGQVVIPPLIDTIPASCFRDCSTLHSVVLPQQLTTIDEYAFSNTPSLESIVIPASLTYIGKKAFQATSGPGLNVLSIYCEVPPTLEGNNSNTVFNKQNTILVNVPCGFESVYQSAPGWSSYDNFVYDFCLGVEDHDPAAFKVWPNPVEDAVNVQCTMNNGQFEVKTVALFDVYGKLVRTETVTDIPARVNVSDLRAGVYLLRVTAADGKEYHQKIVKR